MINVLLFLNFVLCLFIGYLAAGIWKQVRILRILRVNEKLLEKAKRLESGPEKARLLGNIEGRIDVIEKLSSIF